MNFSLAATDLKLFFGHFHPLVVHLPIGFLAVLAVLELADRIRHFKHAAQARGIILGLTAGSAVLAVVLGLMLEESGGYDARLLAFHKWFGIGLAGLCVLTAGAYWGKWHRPYVGLLMLTLLVLGPASHFGGSMTHGADYLTAYAPGWVRRLVGEKVVEVAAAEAGPKLTDPAEALVYEAVVRPVLARHCVSCHGEEKLKGELRLDSIEAIVKGGKSGAAVVGGKAHDSLLVTRMLLPEEDTKHMPPAGKTQLSDDEVAVLRWWVEAGAVADKKVGELEPPVAIADAVAGMLGIAVEKAPGPSKWEEIEGEVAKLNGVPGMVVTRVSPEEPLLSVNAATAREFGDKELELLKGVGANVAWLNLAGTKVTDEGMGVVGSAMPNLQRLRLERTAITDAGLAKLSKLRKLDYLNLYGTAVTDGGMGVLKGLPALRQVYLWKTKVSPEAAAGLAEAKTNRAKIDRIKKQITQLEAEIEGAKVQVVGALAPPVAVATTSPAKKEGEKPAEAVAAVTNGAAAAVTPINTECPISGKPVDATKFVEYKGKRIAFCCDNCPKTFEKDPAKYGEKLIVAAGAK